MAQTPIKKEDFKETYRNLESRVHFELTELINNADRKSSHGDFPSIAVNIFDYEELCLVNNRLVFLDKHGCHYSLYADCTLEDLIDILNAQS